jgi:hypothetical protein
LLIDDRFATRTSLKPIHQHSESEAIVGKIIFNLKEIPLETTEADAKAAIAMLREGLQELDFKRLPRASSLLVRAGVLEPSHGIKLSKMVGFPQTRLP